MEDDQTPEYLTLLRCAWKKSGSPSCRTMSKKIMFSHSAINEAMNGRSIPTRKTLVELASILTAETEARGAIIDAYDAFQQERMSSRRPAEPVQLMSTGQVELIASAIREGLHEIAEAIRGSTRG